MVDETVEVYDAELGRWVAGEVETDGDMYVTVRSAGETNPEGLPIVYAIPQHMLLTHLRIKRDGETHEDVERAGGRRGVASTRDR